MPVDLLIFVARDDLRVQGRSDDQRELLDAEAVAGHLLKPGSVFAFLAHHRGALFPDAMFADLFPSGRGRPSVPADVMASVIVLQTLHGLSDAETVDAVSFDLRWKAAVGWPVTEPGFHPTTLTYWRRRLAASKRPNRIFEVVRSVVAETGVVSGKTRRALDSTVLDDAVATQDTVTQLIAAIRQVRRVVPGAAEVVRTRCTAHDYDDPGKPAIAWNDSQARAVLIDALVRDALAVLAGLQPEQADTAAGEALALLALIAGQDVELVEEDSYPPRWRIARQVAPERVISVVDPEARHAHKTRSRNQDGFKAHVVVEPDTGIITATRLTPAAGPDHSDATVGIELLNTDSTLPPRSAEREDDHGGSGLEVLADSAYGSGDALAALAEAGHLAVIKPWPLRSTVPGGFTLDDFTVDESAGTATCPNGITRAITKTRNVVFGVACRDCPLRPRCTRAADGRSLKLHPHDALQRAHRVRAETPHFQAVYRAHRPMVERSIAWLTRGNRRVPYRGVKKNNAWLHHRVAALNLRRLLALGLHYNAGTWALA